MDTGATSGKSGRDSDLDVLSRNTTVGDSILGRTVSRRGVDCLDGGVKTRPPKGRDDGVDDLDVTLGGVRNEAGRSGVLLLTGVAGSGRFSGRITGEE